MKLETEAKWARRAVKIQFKGRDLALVLKGEEMARRLEGLNGEAGRIAKVLAESMPREVATAKFEQVEKAVSSLRETEANTGGRRTVISPLVGWVGAGVMGIIVGVVIALLTR